jgi:capsular exopolysaccharide synthesis family protein
MVGEDTVELRSILSIIWRRAWLIVGFALLAGTVAFVVVSRTPPSYRATTTMLIMVADSARIDANNSLQASQRLALTYSQMLVEPSLLEAVIAREGLTETAETLKEKISARPIPDTQLMRLTVTDSSPTRAVQIANALAEEFAVRIRTLRLERASSYMSSLESEAQAQASLTLAAQQRLDELTAQKINDQAEIDRQQSLLTGYTEEYQRLLLDLQARPSAANQQQADSLTRSIKESRDSLEKATSKKLLTDIELARQERIVAQYESEQSDLQRGLNEMRVAAAQDADAVVISERASAPQESSRNRLTYVLLATAIAAAVALGVAFLIEHLDQTIKTPEDINHLLKLKTLGQIGQFDAEETDLLVVAQPESPIAQSFRMLAATIRFLQADFPMRTLLVTSPTSSEGKSVVAANLAAALAMSGLRVAVVDADFRLARQHRLFGLFKANGLAESLQGGSIDGNMQHTSVAGLEVLTCGTPPADPTSLVDSPNLPKLLAGLGVNADIVVIDAPPVLPVADSAIIARASDAVLLVVRADHTHGTAAVRAVETLRQANDRLVGAVLNGVPTAGYDSYSAYHYQKPVKSRKIGFRLPLGRTTWSRRR